MAHSIEPAAADTAAAGEANGTTAIPPSLMERRGSGTAVEQALALYRAIFANSTEAIAIIDPDGRYLEQNAAHERLIGYSDDELRGITPAVHLGDDVFASVVDEVNTKGSCRRECVTRTSTGAEVAIELSAFPVMGADGQPVCYVGIKRDISAEKRAASELKRKFDELQALSRMVDAVTRADALEEIYDAALAELQRTLHADRASVLLFDSDGVMRFKAWRGLSTEYRRAVEGHTPWSPDDSRAQPIRVRDVHADASLTPFRAVFEHEGIRSLGFIPLVDSGRLLGKFMIYFDAVHDVSDDEIRIAQMIASHIAFAITRKRSDVALRESEERHHLLAEAGALLSSSLDYGETLRSITRVVVPSLADWCIIDLTDDEGGFDRVAAASADPDEANLAHRLQRHYAPLPESEHGIAHTFITRQSEVMELVPDDMLVASARDTEQLQVLRELGMKSYMCVPMCARGRVTGVMTFLTTKSGRQYDGKDLPLAEELARRAALAVDNARLYRDAHDANRAKSHFLARMSHELRTPLNAIGGYAELLEMGLRGPVNAQQHEDLTRIQRSQRHLLGLINDLLSYAKIESGHVEINVERIIVDDALHAVRALIEPQAAARQIELIQCCPDSGTMCMADHDKFRQIVLNLLSNAVKFTNEHGVVSVDCEAEAETVHIHVNDTGLGIPADKLEAIFQPFVQLSTPITRVMEGAGLGLAISRELARAMNGDVTVVSEPGRGSTFTLTLPRA